MRWALVCFVIACGGTQIQTRNAADLSKLGPATLEATQPKEGEPRSLNVRIWVDAGVRALPGYKDKITEQLDYAGQLLTPLLGVTLKVEAWKDWERQLDPTNPAGDPAGALADLKAADPGKDVAWVIGYMMPNTVASTAMVALGSGELLGHHVVVRAWAEKPEGDVLSDKLSSLKHTERAEVLAAHERHKQTVVLVHWLAKTLGAIDEADEAWIGNPAYSPKQSSFSDRDRSLLQLGADARVSQSDDKDIAHDLLEKIEKENWGGWIASDKDDVTQKLRAIVTAAKQGEAAPDVPVAAVEQFERVKAMAGSSLGKLGGAKTPQEKQAAQQAFATAMAELDNLLTAYPGNAAIYTFKCDALLAHAGPNDKGARAACTRAGELSVSDPRPNFVVAEALVRSKDFAGARKELDAAAKKIETLKTGQQDAWRKLIGIYQGIGSLTWTEDAIASAKLAKDDITPQISSTRARYGVPRGAKFVKPEQEGELVAAVRNALSLVYANKYAEAEKAIRAGEKKWPGAPGFAAVRCDLSLRQTQLEPARASCNKALSIDPNESWALYLSGVIALKDTSTNGTKVGIEKLKLAIAADPELGQAWRTLAKAYARAKDQPALDKLAADYQLKFGSPLPQ
jgi:predicted Zn-dependent protease